MCRAMHGIIYMVSQSETPNLLFIISSLFFNFALRSVVGYFVIVFLIKKVNTQNKSNILIKACANCINTV